MFTVSTISNTWDYYPITVSTVFLKARRVLVSRIAAGTVQGKWTSKSKTSDNCDARSHNKYTEDTRYT